MISNRKSHGGGAKITGKKYLLCCCDVDEDAKMKTNEQKGEWKREVNRCPNGGSVGEMVWTWKMTFWWWKKLFFSHS